MAPAASRARKGVGPREVGGGVSSSRDGVRRQRAPVQEGEGLVGRTGRRRGGACFGSHGRGAEGRWGWGGGCAFTRGGQSRHTGRADTRRGHGRESPSSSGPSVAGGGSVVSSQSLVQRGSVVGAAPAVGTARGGSAAPAAGPGSRRREHAGSKVEGLVRVPRRRQRFVEPVVQRDWGQGQRACSREAESRRGWAGGVSRIHHAGQSCRVRRTIAGSSRAPHPHVVPARPKTDKSSSFK